MCGDDKMLKWLWVLFRIYKMMAWLTKKKKGVERQYNAHYP